MLPVENITPHQLRLFAGLLASPGEESLEIIEQWAEEYPWLQAPAAELKNWSLEWWQAEYTRLFINGYPKTVCPPFESVYCHGVMNAGPCDRLEDFYHSIGLETVEGLPADYLGVMLECAAYLSEQQPFNAAAWETLWQDHFDQWLSRFAKDVQTSELLLYQMLGQQLQQLHFKS